MNAQEVADKFTAKIAVAAVEKNRQTEILHTMSKSGRQTSSTARGLWNSRCCPSWRN
jgi:hypothetical protein